MGLGTRLSWLFAAAILFMAMASVRTEIKSQCDMVAWDSNETQWRQGGEVEVFCQCRNGSSDLDMEHMVTIELEDHQLKNTEFDSKNATMKVKLVALTQTWIRSYQCLFDGVLRQANYFRVYALLNVKDFKCQYIRFDETKTNITCTFTRAEGKTLTELTNYELMMKSTRLDCQTNEENTKQIICTVNINSNDIKPKIMNFRLTMFDTLGNQTQDFNLTQFEMTMLEWPTEHKTFTYNNHPCVSWNRKPVVKDSPAIKWDVQLQPVKYPNLVRSLTLFTKPQPKDTTDTICFENLEGNQKFNVLVKRRINETGAPWSKHYHEFAVQTESKPPDRPPKFLPLGYRYKDQELTVYWEPLKELEWNAPHLEYFVNSKSNRLKASKVGKNFAVFGKWNYKKPDTVFLWSKNEKGLSAEWSRLEVPELTDAMNRKAQNLTLADNILTWEKPVDDENLNGYFFYFCNGTDEVCHSNYTTKLEYNVTGLGAIHKAVAAKYSDHKSGGMKWLSDREDTANIRYVEGIIALLVLGAAFLGARKLKDMSKIGVSVPPGLLLPRTPSVPELAEPSQPYAGVPHPKTLFFNLINMEPIEPADEHIEPEHMEEETSMTVAEQVAQPSGYVMMNAVNPTLCNGYIKPSPPR